MQETQAQSSSEPVISVWRNFEVDVCPQHPEEKAARVCTHQDCPYNLTPMCDTCIDENHSTHANKTIRAFCEELEKIVENSDEHEEEINKAYEAKIENSIISLEKSRYYSTQDLGYLENKLEEYEKFSVSSEINRLLSKLAEAKTENRPDDSLELHKELKKKIKIENNQISLIEISRANEIINFKQELDKEIDKIDQEHKILVDIGMQQRRANSPERTNEVHPFDLFLAENLYNIDKRFFINESNSVEQEERLEKYIDEKLAEEKRERKHEIDRLEEEIAALETEKEQSDGEIRDIEQKLEHNVLNLGNLHNNNNAEALSRILILEEEQAIIEQELKLLVTEEIENINMINQENELKVNKIILKIEGEMDQKYVRELKLNKEQIMEENGNKLLQQFKRMKQVFKLKIVADGENLGADGARNLAAALTEMSQLMVLEVEIRSNNIAKEGAANIAQALSTLTNLTQLTLWLYNNSIGNEGAASIAQALSTLTDLTQLTLYLESNSIGKEGAASIAQALLTLKNLTHLTLYLRELKEEENISEFLGNLSETEKNEIPEASVGIFSQMNTGAGNEALGVGESSFLGGQEVTNTSVFSAGLGEGPNTSLLGCARVKTGIEQAGRIEETGLFGNTSFGEGETGGLFQKTATEAGLYLGTNPQGVKGGISTMEFSVPEGQRVGVVTGVGLFLQNSQQEQQEHEQYGKLGNAEGNPQPIFSLQVQDPVNKIIASDPKGAGEKVLKFIESMKFNDRIGNEGAASIAQALSTLTNLKQLALGLSNNSIGNEGAASIAQALLTLKNLTQLTLWLRHNNIEEEYQEQISELLNKIPKKYISI